MIKKLRKNIILINVLFVGIVMLIIFAVICFNSYSSSRDNIERGLNQVLERNSMPGDFKEDSFKIGNKDMIPDSDIFNVGAYVIVETDSDGSITDCFETNATIDDEVLKSSVSEIFSEGSMSGELGNFNLFYVRRDLMDKSLIAFADSSGVYSSLFNTAVVCSVLFLLGLAIIFLISLGLSYLAVKPVKKAWTQQKRFVADASHELKTPLTVILANNNIMMSHRNSTIIEEQQWLESTDEEAKHMKKLIDQMLFLAKSDAERITPVFEKINISEKIEETVLSFEPIAYEHNIVILSELERDIMIKADKTMVTQLSHIMIDNAVKYAGENGIVTIKAGVNDGMCVFSVNNTGTVIPEEDLAHVFDRFYRADSARSEGGYGLGLSIAYNIVKQLKGKINVESTEQNGTTFFVYFKLFS